MADVGGDGVVWLRMHGEPVWIGTGKLRMTLSFCFAAYMDSAIVEYHDHCKSSPAGFPVSFSLPS